jgi:tRNA (mo5U34)-methyltransferase
VRDLFFCQSMQRGDPAEAEIAEDYPFWETGVFEMPGYPRMAFVEHRYAGDCTNWWIPNRACTAAMLRSAGFAILANPEDEVFVCRPAAAEDDRAVYPVQPRRRRNGNGAA